MIKSGRVAVTEVNASNEVTYGPGDHFGERALLTGKEEFTSNINSSGHLLTHVFMQVM